MTIGELSRRTGVPSSALRYWEGMKVLPKPVRLNGQRRYSQDAVDLVAVLKLTQGCGFSLDQTRRLLHGFAPGTAASERWRAVAMEHRKILDRKIAQLDAMRRLLGRVEKCKCQELTACGRCVNEAMKPKRVRREISK